MLPGGKAADSKALLPAENPVANANEGRLNVSFEQAPEAEAARYSLRRGIMAVAGGMLFHLILGTLYVWGSINSYTPASMKNFDGRYDPAQSKTVDTLQVLPFTVVFQALGMPFATPFYNRFGPGLAMLFAGSLLVVGVCIASFCTSLWSFAVFYSGLYGFGIGLGYTPPLVCGFKHFPKSQGLVSGLILGALGFGGFVFNHVAAAIMNPNKDEISPDTKLFPAEVTDNFAGNLRVLAMIYGLVIVVACSMVRLPKAQGEANTAAASGNTSSSLSSALCTPTFWIMWFCIAFNIQGGMHVASSFKAIALSNPGLASDSYLATVGALGTFSNGLMRPVWGFVYDRIGFRYSLTLIASMQALVMFCFPMLTGSKLLYCLGVMLSFATMAGVFAIAPPESMKIFGSATVYGVLFTAFAFASVLGSKLANFVASNLTPVGGNNDETAFRFLAIMSIVAVCIVQRHRPSLPASTVIAK